MSNESPFDVVAADATPPTSRERWARKYQEWVVAPFTIVRGDIRAQAGGLILLMFAFMSTIGPVVMTVPSPDVSTGLVAPFETMRYPLGTDQLGRSVLGMIVHAAPPMMKMVLSGALFATSLGTVVGLVAGYSGGRIDSVLSTISDVVITIPGLPLTILLILILETTNPFAVGFVLTINMWGGLSRQVRSEVLKLRQSSYVEASAAMGLSTWHIVTRDLLPNVMPYVFMRLMKMARRVIFASVGLYFLGVLPYSRLNWGVIMNNAWANNAVFKPDLYHTLFVPMFTIVLFTYGLTLMAQSTDKIFNPRLRAKAVDEDEA